MTKQFTFLVLIFWALAGIGEALAQEAETSLKDRANLFWNARVHKDWATVYDFLPPEKTAKYTREQFVTFRKEKGPFRFLSANIEEVAVAGNLGWVKLKYTAQPHLYPEISPEHVEIWEPWHIREGHWYPIPAGQRKQVPQLPPHLRPAEEEAALSQRVHEFWKAKEEQNWALLYGYLEPDYRDQVSKAQFLQKKSLYVYSSHQLEWVEVTGKQGRVKVIYSQKLNDPTLYKLKPKENNMIAKWVKVDGEWYRRVNQPGGR